MSLNILSQGPKLASQLQELVETMADIKESLADIQGATKRTVPRIEDAVFEINLASDPTVTGRSVWTDPRGYRIIRCLVSTNTTGRYALRIGDSDLSRRFRLLASRSLYLVNGREAPIAVPPGMSLTVVPDTGSPVWELYAWAVPSYVRGTDNARQ